MIALFIVLLFVGAVVIFTIRKKKRDRVTWKEGDNGVMTLDDKYNSSKVETQREIDKLLDKIGKGGYDSLSSKEKKTLDKYSKKV